MGVVGSKEVPTLCMDATSKTRTHILSAARENGLVQKAIKVQRARGSYGSPASRKQQTQQGSWQNRDQCHQRGTAHLCIYLPE